MPPVQIGVADDNERATRIRFHEATLPWMVIDFDGKFPALDGLVQLTEDEASTTGRALKPFVFFVQIKSKQEASRNRDHSVSLKLEISHVRFWTQLPNPVLIVVYLLDEKQFLYCWASEKMVRSELDGQDSVTIQFPADCIYDQAGKGRIAEFLKRGRDPRPEPFIPPVPSDPWKENAIVRPGQPNLYQYCGVGLSAHTKSHRFRFIENYAEGSSAFVLSALETEPVGLNRHIPHQKGKVQFVYQAQSPSANNMAFFVIPLKKPSDPSQPHLCYEEVENGERKSARFGGPIPQTDYNTGQWKFFTIDFDFSPLRDFGYTVLAPRINEGTPSLGSGELAVNSITVCGC